MRNTYSPLLFLSKNGEFYYATYVHIILYILTLFTYVEWENRIFLEYVTCIIIAIIIHRYIYILWRRADNGKDAVDSNTCATHYSIITIIILCIQISERERRTCLIFLALPVGFFDIATGEPMIRCFLT